MEPWTPTISFFRDEKRAFQVAEQGLTVIYTKPWKGSVYRRCLDWSRWLRDTTTRRVGSADGVLFQPALVLGFAWPTDLALAWLLDASWRAIPEAKGGKGDGRLGLARVARAAAGAA